MSTPSTPSQHHKPHHQTWTRDGFLISTDPSLISIPALTSAFAQEWMYWAKPLPAEAMQAMVDKSLCFGLYTPTPMTETPVVNPSGGGEKSDSDPISRLKASESGARPTTRVPHEQHIHLPHRLRPPNNRQRDLRVPNRRVHPPRMARFRTREMASRLRAGGTRENAASETKYADHGEGRASGGVL